MVRLKNVLVFFWSLGLMLSLAACQGRVTVTATRPVFNSALRSVSVAPVADHPGAFLMTVSYDYDHSEGLFGITCTYPDGSGLQPIVAPVPLQSYGSTPLTLTLQKAGDYAVSCEDGSHSAATRFTVTQAQAGAALVTPITFNTSGTRETYARDGKTSCASLDLVTLEIAADGTARLSTLGKAYIDTAHCLEDIYSSESWNVLGTMDPATHSITFQTCNTGGFTTAGSISYKDGQVSGEVTCFWKTSDPAGRPAMRLVVPAGVAP